ncbi:polysaccharide deacetylase family protein [Candidatus Formimonas warabiya]|uniref:NodB homology domain-containing protein n=1 Tax=Formimonas warabiya TaxID=1761012 RepID=A0A3G1KP06_FORW1|nr:polysaccharide deacetylase family protein [Candidatus Formimonas warabiya]ATW24211.1 hypothetical protein DCMF_04885 [Candidatus Formimonas warabiya]
MRVYYLTKKQVTNGMVGVLILLLIGYLISNYIYHSLVVPTTEITPIYQGSAEKKQISFAINVDWGEEYIPEMLKVFNTHQIKCTFFLTGRWTEKFPELAKSIGENKQEIGNHGYKHDSPNGMSLEENKADIEKAAQIIQSVTGKQTVLYAPASGESQAHVLKAAHELGYQTILWSIDTIDWKNPPPEQILNKVLTKAHNGAIVLMHPTKPTVAALPALISELKKQGYQFVTVSESIVDDHHE